MSIFHGGMLRVLAEINTWVHNFSNANAKINMDKCEGIHDVAVDVGKASEG